jgi:hypothetical protein
MIASRIRGALCFAIGAGIVACESPSGPPAQPPAGAVSVVSGNGQVGQTNQTLSDPLAVRVASSTGVAIKGATVNFSVTAGTATVAPAAATTDTLGIAKTVVTLGSSPGTVTISAAVAGTSLTATFSVTAGSTSTNSACQTSAAQTPGAGTVLPSVSGTGICLGGGTSGADYSLVAFYGNTDSSKVQTLTVTGRGATSVFTPDIIPNFNVAPSLSFLQEQPNTAQDAFDRTLRETSRRELTPLISAARLRRQQQSAALATIPGNPPVGSLVTLNANGIQACTAIKSRTARVAAVSNTAIVVADTANPAGGFSDSEYAGFATMFDTLINPLDVTNFGQPTDVDQNGKIVIFFTKEVNALTPKGSTGGVIGGFFFERDLFPLTTQNGLQGCAGSNFAEMFYVLVPDSAGLVSNPASKTYVTRVTPGTLAHEYQHLINAGRRMYVNNANSFEDTWLNEGLSHVAEELLFYRVSGLPSRANIGVSQLNTQALVNAFNNYQIDNTIRYEIFLSKPTQTSVYGGNDSLETRGATWSLLRYLTDHASAPEATTWQALVNSTTNGQLNLARVFGDYMTMIRNWSISVISDDVTGVTDARFLQSSWNYRGIFPNLVDSQGNRLGKYPLQVFPLSDQSTVNTSVFAGGAAYIRFSVPAGSQASVDWSGAAGAPVSPLMSFTVVRSR